MINTHENETIHREIDTDTEELGVEVPGTLANIEGKELTDLTTTYECVGGGLNDIFSNLPPPEAQRQISFSYENYRVTIEQNGGGKFVKAE